MKIAFVSLLLIAIVFAKHKDTKSKFIKIQIHNAAETNPDVAITDNMKKDRPLALL